MDINDCEYDVADFQRTCDEISVRRVVNFFKDINCFALANLIEEYAELKQKIEWEELLPESVIEERVEDELEERVEERVEEKVDEQLGEVRHSVQNFIQLYQYEALPSKKEKFSYTIVKTDELDDLENRFHDYFSEWE